MYQIQTLTSGKTMISRVDGAEFRWCGKMVTALVMSAGFAALAVETLSRGK